MKAELLHQSVRDGRTVIEYQIQPNEMMDGLVLKQCKEGSIPGVLPMGAAYEDGHNYMYAYVDKKETLAKQMEEPVTQRLVLSSFENIACTLLRLEEQGINPAYVVLDDRYVYINEETGRADIICMPGKNVSMESREIPDFFRRILSDAVYLNSEDGDYVAKLLSALNRDFELKSFLRQIHYLMTDVGIEIPEEPKPGRQEASAEEPEPGAVEPIEQEPPIAEPVAVEPIGQEPPIAEPVAAEPIGQEPVIAEPIGQEPVIAEPVAAEPIGQEPVIAEPVAAEPIGQESPIAEPMASKPSAGRVIPEDEIEFEPMPEALNAKIERMNVQSQQPQTPQMSSQPPVQPRTPQMSSQPPVQPQTPQPMPPQPTPSQPQHQQPVTPGPMAQPNIPMQSGMPQPMIPDPAIRPNLSPQPGMQRTPQPQMMPQDATFRQYRELKPHLVRVKTGENISLPEGSFVIGKAQSGVNYTISDNTAVSRVHCTIIKRNGAYYVRDENSTNSTYVNGERVLPETEKLLLNNCKLVLGDEEFIYSLW